MATAQNFFIHNIKLLPTGFAGKPDDQQAWNLQQGLLAMAKQLDEIQAQQKSLASHLSNVESLLRGLR